jgi:hypothetical protein
VSEQESEARMWGTRLGSGYELNRNHDPGRNIREQTRSYIKCTKCYLLLRDYHNPSRERLGDGLVEGLALDRADLELKRGRLARAVGGRERARTPGGATVDLSEVGALRERAVM